MFVIVYIRVGFIVERFLDDVVLSTDGTVSGAVVLVTLSS
jgi:hypothetical protein